VDTLMLEHAALHVFDFFNFDVQLLNGAQNSVPLNTYLITNSLWRSAGQSESMNSPSGTRSYKISVRVRGT
jgi:hypothetical protein